MAAACTKRFGCSCTGAEIHSYAAPKACATCRAQTEQPPSGY
jgi:hypothetical protein